MRRVVHALQRRHFAPRRGRPAASDDSKIEDGTSSDAVMA